MVDLAQAFDERQRAAQVVAYGPTLRAYLDRAAAAGGQRAARARQGVRAQVLVQDGRAELTFTGAGRAVAREGALAYVQREMAGISDTVRRQLVEALNR